METGKGRSDVCNPMPLPQRECEEVITRVGAILVSVTASELCNLVLKHIFKMMKAQGLRALLRDIEANHRIETTELSPAYWVSGQEPWAWGIGSACKLLRNENTELEGDIQQSVFSQSW